jgi:hypothetical protein
VPVHQVLHVGKWDFTDEKTGEIKKGISVWFLPRHADDEEGSRGLKPIKMTGKESMFYKFAEVPGQYDLEIELTQRKAGAMAVLVAVHPVGPAEKAK